MKPFFSIPFIGAVVLGLCLSGCDQGPEPNPGPPTIEFPADFAESDFAFSETGEEKTLTFTASADWTLAIENPWAIKSQTDDWCTVTPLQGTAGPTTVRISTTRNESINERVAKIAIHAGETSKSFTIRQREKDAMILSSKRFELSSGEGRENSIYDQFTADVQIASNVEVSFRIPEEHQFWLYPVQPAEKSTKALSTNIYTFAAKPNVHEQPREGIVIFFNAQKNLSDTAYITQKAGIRDFEVRTLLEAWPGKYMPFIKSYYLCEALYVHALPDENGLSSDLRAFYDHRLTSSLQQIDQLWSAAWQPIHWLNTILRIIRPSDERTFEDLLPYEYSIHIRRSLTYLQMIHFWGDAIPLALKYDPLGNPPMQIPADQICGIFIDSLKNYKQHMPEEPVSKYTYPPSVAEAVLAKLHFQRREYTEALRYARAVIDCGRYTLEATYDNAFTAQSSEAILTFPTPANSASDYFHLVRKGPYSPVVRLAEILLIAAESGLQLGDPAQAVETLNPLRLRNGRTALCAADDRAQILAAILEEWEKDLGKEGLFFAALKRNGLAESTLQIESFRKLFPIPNSEINYNLYARQNPGY